MGRFEGFYTGETESTPSGISPDGFCHVTHSDVKFKHYKTRQERVWATDYYKCSSKEDYQNYIRKYQRYSYNPFVVQAQEDLETILEEEEFEMEEEYSNQESVYSPSQSLCPQSSTTASAKVINSNVNKQKGEKDPYLVLRILGTIAVFFVYGFIAINLLDVLPTFVRGLMIISAPIVGKWIWSKD